MDIAGGREVPLIGVCKLHVLGLITCVGCDIVQADHAPEAGVAQGIFHGVLVRHQGRHQEGGRGTGGRSRETGEERTLKQPNTSAHAWMTWNDTQGETLSQKCDV